MSARIMHQWQYSSYCFHQGETEKKYPNPKESVHVKMALDKRPKGWIGSDWDL